ncbi:PREDICTED: RNA/RNP complex-1-interacting phosphatase isoform X2 [Haliaeetus leucocephalus]|uniref:RNA/RNP complex-1-interacting phosphatase isoform X2 n=1 Tax=Haliaeetus leucocephalus TaxID=52644 RepID=UPI00053CAF53|nr:PREDICTED: RNA/RNP complex-1-interacting phosphatase isoform X2 [Haliaeetus leucocephalus]
MVGRGACRVPDRWTDYLPLGRRMPGTRFIAFKVPLKQSFDQNLHPEERFSPRDLIKKIKEQKEELGLIIDLTYTTRYYGPEVSLGLTVRGVKLCVSPDIADKVEDVSCKKELPATLCYSKILTMGHEIPNRHTIFQFKCVVKKFLRDNKDNDKLIGVHCTHGLNRTGYLVCRYLIDVEGMDPNTAIELFNRARGHPIERTNYIQDLRKRSVKKNCGLKNLGSGPFKEKAGATPNTKKQMAKHHPHQSNQSPLAVPRNSSSAKKNRRRGAKAQAQHQELAREHGATEQRQPRSLAVRNCWVSLPTEERHNGLSFPAQSSHLCPSQETRAARRRRRRHRKPVVTA